MAVDVCSEISSPRISFSHDLNGLDFVPIESHAPGSDSHFDFEFDFRVHETLEISPADELFADGKILPVQIKPIARPVPRPGTLPPDPVPEPSIPAASVNKKRLIEFLSAGADAEDEENPERRDRDAKPPTFWQFRRSSSDNSRASGLLRPWQFLTRSNSTGSVPSPKQTASPKGIQKQHSLKEDRRLRPNPSSALAFNPYCNYGGGSNTSKKPSLRKNSSGGVRISPVLNIPPSYLAKGTVSLFGFGSLFCSKKSKKKRK